jgi:molybdopterin molybdotransferase
MTGLLEVSAALEIVLQHAQRLSHVSAALTPSLLGRVLAEDVASDIDSPPFDKSMMDGYALRASDSGGAFTVIEEIAAGKMPTRSVGPGQASRVMTGAPVPEGTDAVVPHEETEAEGDLVRVRTSARSGQHILTRGREMKLGEIVVPAGTILTPAAMGLLAAVGRTSVMAYPAAKVAIISTGDELVEPSERPGPGQIRNSNGPMLLALAARSGTEARYLGIARDDPTALAAMVRDALSSANIVLLSGGVSAGKFDFVPDVLHDCGVQAHFHKIRMKPGKPLLFGSREKTLVFGLPGNPVASFVGFELLVRPALRKMSGHMIAEPSFIPLPLVGELKTRNDRPTYLPAKVEGMRVRATPWFGSADLRAMLTTDALVRVDAGDVTLPEGTLVPTLTVV